MARNSAAGRFAIGSVKSSRCIFGVSIYVEAAVRKMGAASYERIKGVQMMYENNY